MRSLGDPKSESGKLFRILAQHDPVTTRRRFIAVCNHLVRHHFGTVHPYIIHVPIEREPALSRAPPNHRFQIALAHLADYPVFRGERNSRFYFPVARIHFQIDGFVFFRGRWNRNNRSGRNLPQSSQSHRFLPGRRKFRWARPRRERFLLRRIGLLFRTPTGNFRLLGRGTRGRRCGRDRRLRRHIMRGRRRLPRPQQPHREKNKQNASRRYQQKRYQRRLSITLCRRGYRRNETGCQRFGKFQAGPKTIIRIVRQSSCEDRVCRRRYLRANAGRGRKSSSFADCLRGRAKRQPLSVQMISRGCQSILVGARADAVAVVIVLRCEIRMRPFRRKHPRVRPCSRRHREIAYLNFVRRQQKYIRRLKVPVHHSILIGIMQRPRNPANQTRRFFDRESLLFQGFLEGFVWHILDRAEGVFAFIKHLQHRNNPGLSQSRSPARRLHEPKPLKCRLFCSPGRLRLKVADCHLSCFRFGQEHRPSQAGPELLNNPIAFFFSHTCSLPTPISNSEECLGHDSITFPASPSTFCLCS